MLVLKALRRLGLDVAPYIVYVETGAVPQAPIGESFEQTLITGANVKHLLDRHGTKVNAAKWQERASTGDFGLLLERDGELVGYTWASERWFLGIDNRPLFELTEREAYLFDTYVAPAYRGRSIAILLRELMAGRLAAFGRTALYSFTLVRNAPARRFKEKLGATPIELRVRVRIFGRWFADFVLKRWRPRVPASLRWGRLRQRLRV